MLTGDDGAVRGSWEASGEGAAAPKRSYSPTSDSDEPSGPDRGKALSGVFRKFGKRDELVMLLHDLRSPLFAMTAGIQYLSETGSAELTADQRASLLDRLGNITRRVLDLTSRTLDAAAGEQRQLCLEEVDLPRLVEELAGSLEPLLLQSGCQLSVHSARPVVGRWDPFNLWHILENILLNALKYGQGKPVVVCVWREGAHAIVTVEDQGGGWKTQSLLFERLTQGHLKNAARSHGLGLWIVEQLTTQLGGEVENTTAIGGGCRVMVRLPLAGPDAATRGGARVGMNDQMP